MLDFRLVSGPLGDMDVLILQDLTRLESGNETSFNEPFDLHTAIADAVLLYRYVQRETRSSFFFKSFDAATRPLGGTSPSIWMRQRALEWSLAMPRKYAR